nr:MAG TPA: hypothetical protein [Caudoviricetes sp.]
MKKQDFQYIITITSLVTTLYINIRRFYGNNK